MPEPRNLLLTAPPGAGKTTALRAVARRLAARVCGGFVTEELRDASGQRIGFALMTFDGQRHAMAHRDLVSPRRVGRYGVDVERVDYAADVALSPRPDRELFIVDEIGKMECLSARFVRAVERLLDDPRPLVASVAARGGGLIEAVKARPDVRLWELSARNRDALPDRVVDWLAAREREQSP